MTEQRFALMEGDKVVNLILWDSDTEYDVPEGLSAIAVSEEIGIDWVKSGDSWVQPETIEPVSPPELVEEPTVTDAKFEALRQLTALGITDPVARTIVGLPPA